MSTTKFTDNQLQSIIGNVLRYGVLSALTVTLLGGIILLAKDSQQVVSFSTFVEKDQNLFVVFKTIFQGVKDWNGESIIFLGILLLFLTPALRLLLSLFSFILEKDAMYVVITLIVIAVIILSVSFGFSH
ncbi:putative membrane protein [Myroides gitamensis]|uniref:Predicted membrane protein n=1 Tax=Myroides odoratus TaxID=256 RepID=A0A378U6F4_MYROD|nr:DUF1634 domain-containing protein [Myroides odoratus]MCS4237619.1 putative membrane protein [Myroides odoratus]MDH6601642.1 putative membrane protein [Myroides gitamensis]QQU02855.1 DUF1634 domain-containing protein [Myroides odoratus]STZ69912.1 Predicted membrane protein [Myroides odoratus]